MKRVVVCGFMTTCPIAGVVWQHVHYLSGLKKLGYDPIYIEDSARFPYDPHTFETGEAAIPLVAKTIGDLAKKFGFKWAYRARFTNPMQVYGDLTDCQINDAFTQADVTFNLCGAQELHEEIAKSKCLVYIESDPGVEQIKLDKKDLGTLNYLKSHHFRFTFGENIGQSDCPLPKGGLDWYPTRQPIDLDIWKTDAGLKNGSKRKITSIANWETKGKDITWKNDIYYWSKTFEFLKYADLPRQLTSLNYQWELGTDMSKDSASEQLFQRQGWSLHKPHHISANFDDYIKYIQQSDVEWTVAKDQYVRLKTGWFSDRSACYLAAGKPVITQDTCFGKYIPTGEGLFSFRTLAEVKSALELIASDYDKHSKKALEIAREYFSADKVMKQILTRIGI
jgi:hypothetical protein